MWTCQLRSCQHCITLDKTEKTSLSLSRCKIPTQNHVENGQTIWCPRFELQMVCAIAALLIVHGVVDLWTMKSSPVHRCLLVLVRVHASCVHLQQYQNFTSGRRIDYTENVTTTFITRYTCVLFLIQPMQFVCITAHTGNTNRLHHHNQKRHASAHHHCFRLYAHPNRVLASGFAKLRGVLCRGRRCVSSALSHRHLHHTFLRVWLVSTCIRWLNAFHVIRLHSICTWQRTKCMHTSCNRYMQTTTSTILTTDIRRAWRTAGHVSSSARVQVISAGDHAKRQNCECMGSRQPKQTCR